jgi:glutaredoxin
MSDAECPYCLKDTEICHDDGYGYDESRVYEQECVHCGKTFAYRTRISFDYDTEQAPCMNGGDHYYLKRCRYGIRGQAETYMQCKVCEHELKQPATAPAGGG